MCGHQTKETPIYLLADVNNLASIRDTFLKANSYKYPHVDFFEPLASENFHIESTHLTPPSGLETT